MKILISIILGIYIMRDHGILEMILSAVAIYMILGGIQWIII